MLFVIGIGMCDDSPENASTGDGTELTTGTTDDGAFDDQQSGTCYLKTLDVVDLLADADPNAETVGTLPANAQFEILQTKSQIDADGEFEFHLIQTDDGQGWVEHNDNLIRLSPGCN
ncbi:MAG: SH3 domain-containing protein [Lewinellaceae bacterium]|nr:SH3 domain-containing protein [Lewinellaceae bacterium]